jgi:hypothetical protein
MEPTLADTLRALSLALIGHLTLPQTLRRVLSERLALDAAQVETTPPDYVRFRVVGSLMVARDLVELDYPKTAAELERARVRLLELPGGYANHANAHALLAGLAGIHRETLDEQAEEVARAVIALRRELDVARRDRDAASARAMAAEDFLASESRELDRAKLERDAARLELDDSTAALDHVRAQVDVIWDRVKDDLSDLRSATFPRTVDGPKVPAHASPARAAGWHPHLHAVDTTTPGLERVEAEDVELAVDLEGVAKLFGDASDAMRSYREAAGLEAPEKTEDAAVILGCRDALEPGQLATFSRTVQHPFEVSRFHFEGYDTNTHAAAGIALEPVSGYIGTIMLDESRPAPVARVGAVLRTTVRNVGERPVDVVAMARGWKR